MNCKRPSSGFFIVVNPEDITDLSRFNVNNSPEYPIVCKH